MTATMFANVTRTYVAKRLLEHGALTFSEFLEITGWTGDEAWAALRSLVDSGVAYFTEALGERRRVYHLRDGA